MTNGCSKSLPRSNIHTERKRGRHAPHTNRQCPNIVTIIRIDLFGCQFMRFLVINWCVHSVDSTSRTCARRAFRNVVSISITPSISCFVFSVNYSRRLHGEQIKRNERVPSLHTNEKCPEINTTRTGIQSVS